VKEGLLVFGGNLLAKRPVFARTLVCKRFASRAGSIEAPHRFVGSAERRVEIRAGLMERRVAEHVLDVMHGPARFEQLGTAFLPEIVEVEIDRPVRGF
jgi:hypothetical protein